MEPGEALLLTLASRSPEAVDEADGRPQNGSCERGECAVPVARVDAAEQMLGRADSGLATLRSKVFPLRE